MKIVSIVLMSLVAVVSAHADGFRCQGDNFRVKMFNEVQPDRGTRNPAALVVSERDHGTIATLEGDEIEKKIGSTTVSFAGKTNGYQDGRYVYVKLTVAKAPISEGQYAGLHAGRLSVNADGEQTTEKVLCKRYLKTAQE